MKFFKKLFASKEIQAVLGILAEANCKFNCPAFEKIHNTIENAVLSNSRTVEKQIRNGLSPRQYVYTIIANISGDMVGTGHYHMHRGILNPMDIGFDLLNICEKSIDELVVMGCIDKDTANNHKTAIHKDIETVG